MATSSSPNCHEFPTSSLLLQCCCFFYPQKASTSHPCLPSGVGLCPELSHFRGHGTACQLPPDPERWKLSEATSPTWGSAHDFLVWLTRGLTSPVSLPPGALLLADISIVLVVETWATSLPVLGHLCHGWGVPPWSMLNSVPLAGPAPVGCQ